MGQPESFFAFHDLKQCFLLVSENRHERKHSFVDHFFCFLCTNLRFLEKMKKMANFGPD